MNVRPLSSIESKNLSRMNDAGITSSLVFVTATALNKAILDATSPVRDLLRDGDIHDYAAQAQGQDSKRFVDAVLLTDDSTINLRMSMYRPTTKQGDPRMWFLKLGLFRDPDEVLAVFLIQRTVYVVNLSRIALHLDIV